MDRYLAENAEGDGKSRKDLWGNPILNGKGGGKWDGEIIAKSKQMKKPKKVRKE